MTTLRLGGKCLGTQNSRPDWSSGGAAQSVLSTEGVGGEVESLRAKRMERGV